MIARYQFPSVAEFETLGAFVAPPPHPSQGAAMELTDQVHKLAKAETGVYVGC